MATMPNGPMRDSWPTAFFGYPRGHRVGTETWCWRTQELTFPWILTLEPNAAGIEPPMIEGNAESGSLATLTIAVDHFIFSLNEGSKIQPHLCRRETWITRMRGLVDDPRGFDQIFGRKTSAIGTRSPDDAFFRHDGCLAQLRRAQRRRERRRAGTENHQTKSLRRRGTAIGHHLILPISVNRAARYFATAFACRTRKPPSVLGGFGSKPLRS